MSRRVIMKVIQTCDNSDCGRERELLPSTLLTYNHWMSWSNKLDVSGNLDLCNECWAECQNYGGKP